MKIPVPPGTLEEYNPESTREELKKLMGLKVTAIFFDRGPEKGSLVIEFEQAYRLVLSADGLSLYTRMTQ